MRSVFAVEEPAAAPDRRAPIAAVVRHEVERVEKERILAALDEHAGNQTKAARALGVSRRTFLRRLDQYGLNRPRKRRR
jgi:DNA-binding NtrC family response regulator